MFLDEKNIGMNLESVRVALNKSYKDIADIFGVTPDSFKMYVRNTGGKKASSKVTEIIGLGVSGNWYLTGQGEMFNKKGDPEYDSYAEIGRQVMKLKEMLDDMSALNDSVVKAETFSAQNDSSSAQLSSANALPEAESSLKRRNPDGQYDDQGIDDDFTVYESGPEFSPEEMKVLDDFARQTVSHQDLP